MSCAVVGQLLLFFFVMPILQKEKRKKRSLMHCFTYIGCIFHFLVITYRSTGSVLMHCKCISLYQGEGENLEF